MSKEEQRFYKANPYNIEKGFVEGKLKVKQKTPVVNIGSCQFIGDGGLFLVDDENLLSIEINEGRLELSMKLYDQNDNLVAEIERNEWVSGNPLPWDLESKFQWFRIRRKLRDIQLEIDAREYPINIRADMWRNGVNFQLTPNEVVLARAPGRIAFGNLCFVGSRLKADMSKEKYIIAPHPRFGHSIISYPDIKERIKIGLSAWKELTCKHEFVTIIDKKKYTVMECRKCGKIEKIWK